MRFLFPLVSAVCAVILPLSPSALAGTKVRIATPVGNIDLELYDADKPATVQNFLSYVESGRYDGTLLHRLIPGFIVQGGGFIYDANQSQFSHVETFAAVPNEYAVGPLYSNTTGTIAMAKVPAQDPDTGEPIPGGGPDSATSEWFINLGNNSANLDNQNGGFTVFGHVIAGLEILQRFNTTFADGEQSTDAVVNAGGFSNLPTLKVANGQIQIADLLFTNVSVLKDPVPATEVPRITVKGTKFRTSNATLKIGGTASSGVNVLEWRFGNKGNFRRQSVGTVWKMRIGGLKLGTNVVALRGVNAAGTRGALVKVRIIRK